MGVFEKNLFLHGIENDEAGVDIPQHIGENAGGIAEGFLGQGRLAVFAGQQFIEKGLYQEKHTMMEKEVDLNFFHGSRFEGKGKRGREYFDFYCGGSACLLVIVLSAMVPLFLM
ncbi:MAG: hypothetical protein KKG34_00330 [Proteobacteria bacterium]|nr:hypothetical protein [Pseudomonadota bacterium]